MTLGELLGAAIATVLLGALGQVLLEGGIAAIGWLVLTPVRRGRASTPQTWVLYAAGWLGVVLLALLAVLVFRSLAHVWASA
jgi:hypothetical protein